jgi:hypothetical protein
MQSDSPPLAPHPAFRRSAAVLARFGMSLRPAAAQTQGLPDAHPTYVALAAALRGAEADAGPFLEDASLLERAVYELGLFSSLLRAAMAGEPAPASVDPRAADTAFATGASIRVLWTRWDWDGFLADSRKTAPDERDTAWALRLPPTGPIQVRRLDVLPALLLEACAYPLTRRAAFAAVAAATELEGDPARLAAIIGDQVDALHASGLLLPSAPTAAEHAVEEMLRLLPAEDPPPQAAARGVAGRLARAVRSTREDVERAARATPGSSPVLQMDRAVGGIADLLSRARLRDAFSTELEGYWAETDVAARAALISPLLAVLDRAAGRGVHTRHPYLISL